MTEGARDQTIHQVTQKQQDADFSASNSISQNRSQGLLALYFMPGCDRKGPQLVYENSAANGRSGGSDILPEKNTLEHAWQSPQTCKI